MIEITPESVLIWSLILSMAAGAVGWFTGRAYEIQRMYSEIFDQIDGPAAAWSAGSWWCADHAPPGDTNLVLWAVNDALVAPERCAEPGCEIEILELANHRLDLKDLALGVARFREMTPVAQDRVRAAMDYAASIDGCVVCGEIGCHSEHGDAIEVAHEFDDHSRCSIWCSEKLGAIDLR